MKYSFFLIPLILSLACSGNPKPQSAVELKQEAESFWAQESYQQAYRAYQRLQILYPQSSEATGSAARSESAQKLAAEQNLYHKADANFRNKSFDRAKELYELFSEQYPDSKLARKTAKKIAASSDERSVELLYEKAVSAARREELDKAYRLLKQLRNNHPENSFTADAEPVYQDVLGQLQVIWKAAAKKKKREQMRREKAESNRLYSQGMANFEVNELKEARDSFAKLVSKYPKSTHFNRARDKMRRIERMIAEKLAHAVYLDAVRAYRARDYPKALRLYEEIRNKYKQSTLVYKARDGVRKSNDMIAKSDFDQARILDRDGKEGKAISQYQAVIKKYGSTRWAEEAEYAISIIKSSGEAKVYYGKARKLYDSKDYAGAKTAYEEMINKYPQSPLVDRAVAGIIETSAAFIFTDAQQDIKAGKMERAVGKLRELGSGDYEHTAWFGQAKEIVDNYENEQADKALATADAIFAAGKYKPAVLSFQNVISSFKKFDQAMVAKTRIVDVHNKMIEVAIQKVDKAQFAEQQYPQAIKAYEKLYQMFQEDNRMGHSIDLAIKKSHEAIIDRFMAKGNAAAVKFDTKGAIAAFKKILKLYPDWDEHVEVANLRIAEEATLKIYRKFESTLEAQKFLAVYYSLRKLHKEDGNDGKYATKARDKLAPALAEYYQEACTLTENKSKRTKMAGKKMLFFIYDYYPDFGQMAQVKKRLNALRMVF